MLDSGITNPFVLAKERKAYLKKYYGVLVSYDESLVSDASLADSLWKNMYTQEDSATPEKLNLLVHYIRRELCNLHQTNIQVIMNGQYKWGDPITKL